MSNIDTGGPAFPVTSEPHSVHDEGMTLRDYFAAKVASGDAAADGGWSNDIDDESIASRASLYYRVADAMLKAREA